MVSCCYVHFIQKIKENAKEFYNCTLEYNFCCKVDFLHVLRCRRYFTVSFCQKCLLVLEMLLEIKIFVGSVIRIVSLSSKRVFQEDGICMHANVG